MSAYSTNATVQSGITDYTRGRARPGERPRDNAYTGRPISVVDPTLNVAQVTTVEITASSNSDTPSLTIDGAVFDFVSSTTDALTAAALAAVLEAQLDDGDLLGTIVEGVGVVDETVTITFSDYVAHTVVFNAQGSTTATVTDTADASAEVNHKGGVFLTAVADDGDPSMRSAHLPASVSETILGILTRGPYPNHTTPPNPYGLTGDETWPSGVQMVLDRDGEQTARLGANVNEGDPVYVIMDPSSPYNGHAIGTETFTGGANQVTRGDVEFHGTDLVGLNVDGYIVSVASNTSDDQTATDLRNAWNADTYAASIATASIDLSGTESYIILTFADYSTHIVQAYSPATADVSGLTNTTAAAAQTATSKLLNSRAKFLETRTLAQGSAYVELG